MKKTIISCFVMGFTAAVYAQGCLILNNNANSSTDPYATSDGLFWLSTAGTPALIHQDFNAAFYAGTDSSNLSPLATLLLSNGTATGDNSFGPGTLVDPSGKNYSFPSTTSVFVQIQAWTGSFNSYAAAVSGGALAAQSPVFVNPVEVPPGPAADLTGMPAMILSTIPEPSTFALCGIGSLLAVICWQRKRITGESVRN
jgi:hypothetical protein